MEGFKEFRCTDKKCRSYGNDKYIIYLPMVPNEEDGTMNVLSCTYCREYSLKQLSTIGEYCRADFVCMLSVFFDTVLCCRYLLTFMVYE